MQIVVSQNNRVLRSNDKFIFKVDRKFKIGTKYQHSPYYKGTLLWNELPVSVQTSNDVTLQTVDWF